MAKYDIAAEIAAEMNSIMNSPSYQAIFTKPSLQKTAAVKKEEDEECEKGKGKGKSKKEEDEKECKGKAKKKAMTKFEVCVAGLAKISKVLDDAGFDKAATYAVLSLDSLVSKAMPTGELPGNDCSLANDKKSSKKEEDEDDDEKEEKEKDKDKKDKKDDDEDSEKEDKNDLNESEYLPEGWSDVLEPLTPSGKTEGDPLAGSDELAQSSGVSNIFDLSDWNSDDDGKSCDEGDPMCGLDGDILSVDDENDAELAKENPELFERLLEKLEMKGKGEGLFDPEEEEFYPEVQDEPEGSKKWENFIASLGPSGEPGGTLQYNEEDIERLLSGEEGELPEFTEEEIDEILPEAITASRKRTSFQKLAKELSFLARKQQGKKTPKRK